MPTGELTKEKASGNLSRESNQGKLDGSISDLKFDDIPDEKVRELVIAKTTEKATPVIHHLPIVRMKLISNKALCFLKNCFNKERKSLKPRLNLSELIFSA